MKYGQIASKLGNALLAGVACFTVAACGSEITDPDKDDDHDVSVGSTSGQVIGPNPDPVGTATATPNPDCIFAQASQADSKLCYRRDPADQDNYSSISCGSDAPNTTWVRAIGNTLTPTDSKEVWVLVNDDDPHFRSTTIPPADPIIEYVPNLIYLSAGTFEHRQCNIKVELDDDCPSPAQLPSGGKECLMTGTANPTL